MKRPTLATGEIYHIYNRGVEKRQVFSNQKDYLRFVQGLFDFNDADPVINLDFYFEIHPLEPRKQRKPLVDIFCFALMPNHYHLLIRQLVDGGITKFMRKLGTGYTNYFNTKYKRVGPLFQGKFKVVHISKESQFLYLPHYIHLNPLDIIMSDWQERGIHDIKRAFQFLDSYRWSSYLDYIGKTNFPLVTNRDFLLDIYGSRTSIEADLEGWLNSFTLKPIREVVIE